LFPRDAKAISHFWDARTKNNKTAGQRRFSMVNTQPRRNPPRDLKKRGKRLWRSVFDDYEPSPTEEQILLDLCRTLDEIDVLTAVLAQSEMVVAGSTGQLVVNPVIGALREHRKLAVRLSLALAVPGEGETYGRRRSTSARAAAQARWHRKGAA
jgi:hypothetical protein